MPADLFADTGLRPVAKPLTVFRAELIGYEDSTWEELFAGFTSLKAITFSSSIEFLVRLADRLDDAEIVFGSESILSKEHLALAQASQTVSAYGFADALADHKALTEALARLLGSGGRTLLARVLAGSLRFRLLRGRPSHEKLYLLSGPAGGHRLGQSQPRGVRGAAAGDLCHLRRRAGLGVVRRPLPTRLARQRRDRARCARHREGRWR